MSNNYGGHLPLIVLFPTRFEAGRPGFLDGRAPGTELKTERLCNFEYRGELDTSITRKISIQVVEADTGITRQLIHCLRINNSAKSLCNLCRIVSRIVDTSIKPMQQFFICCEGLSLRSYQPIGFGVTHNDLLKALQNVEGEPYRSSRLFPTVAKSTEGQYRPLVVTLLATDLGGLISKRRNSAPIRLAGAFFTSAILSYGGLRRSTLGCVGFLLPRSANSAQFATLTCLAADSGGSPAKGAPTMNTFIPSKIRALAHRCIALSALRADSAISARLKRYNAHMAIARALEIQGGEM